MTADSQGVPLNGQTTTNPNQSNDSTFWAQQMMMPQNNGMGENNDVNDADSLYVFSPNSTLASSGGSYHFNEEPHKQTNLSNLNNWSQSIVHEQEEENIIDTDIDTSMSGLNVNATTFNVNAKPFITPPPGFGL